MPNLLSPAVVVSYPHLFKAVPRKKVQPGQANPPKFSASFLFTQAAMDTDETKAILAAVQAAGIEKWGKTAFEAMVNEGTFESPFKRDISAKGYPSGFVRYISSDSGENYPPAVVSRFIDPATGKLAAITDPKEIYPGAVVRVSLSPRAYGGPGTGFKPGVKLDLRNVQKIGDGERLAGGSSDAGDDFGPGEAPQQASEEASLTGMLG